MSMVQLLVTSETPTDELDAFVERQATAPLTIPGETAVLAQEPLPSQHISRTIDHAVDIKTGHDVEKGTALYTTSSSSSSSTLHRLQSESDSITLSKKSQQNTQDPKARQTLVVAAQEKKDDPFVVRWSGDDDPENPVNWSQRRKWLNTCLVTYNTFLTTFASSMFAPTVPQILQYYDSDDQMKAAFLVSLGLLGWMFGPMLFSPMSELYGRRNIYLISTVLHVIWLLVSPFSPDLDTLLAFRFLAGLAGGAALCLAPGSIADLFRQEQRGRAMSLWSATNLIGPVVGPVIGGAVASAAGWRWVFWTATIAGGAGVAASLLVLDETYPPILLERRAERLRKETGDTNHHVAGAGRKTPRELLAFTLVRPLKMFTRIPIISCLSVITATHYGLVYLLFATLSLVFADVYHFGEVGLGLVFLGLGIGCMVGSLTYGMISDPLVKRWARGGEMKPEYRLPLLIPASIIVPCGLMLYGWTVEYRVHWIVPVLGTGLMGFGTMFIFMSTALYIVDAWPLYAASGIAACSLLRYLAGAFLPMSAPALYERLGYGWGNTLLGLVGMVMILPTVYLCKKGEWLRTHPRFQVDL